MSSSRSRNSAMIRAINAPPEATHWSPNGLAWSKSGKTSKQKSMRRPSSPARATPKSIRGRFRREAGATGGGPAHDAAAMAGILEGIAAQSKVIAKFRFGAMRRSTKRRSTKRRSTKRRSTKRRSTKRRSTKRRSLRK